MIHAFSIKQSDSGKRDWTVKVQNITELGKYNERDDEQIQDPQQFHRIIGHATENARQDR
jgi:hypothetical protein